MKRILTIFLIVIMVSSIFTGIIFFSENVSSATNVSGSISVNTTWTAINSPYYVVGDVIVENGTTLTIEPGVTVKFDGLYSLIVNGTLNATGTSNLPIVFTSNKTTPAKGDWNRIRLHGKNNTMHYCEISFGHYALYIMGENTNNSISHCNIYDNDGDGIYLKKTTNNTLDNVTVSTSYSNGITLLVSENNIINNSYFENNRAFGIYLRSSNNNTIINTNVSGNKGGGIEFGLINHNIKIQNATVFENMDNGIDLNGNDHINITDSRIISNDGNGIDFGGPSEHQWIENCTIKDNGESGIYLQRATFVDIIGCNILRNKGSAGIYSDKKVEKINITNSKIWENSEDGIEIYEAKYVNISDSNISNNKFNGINFNGGEIQEKNIIRNCSIAWNGNSGICFYAYTNSLPLKSNIHYNDIFNNRIFLNNHNGIYFETYTLYYQDDSYSYLQYNYIYNNTIFLNNQNGIYFKDYSDDYSYNQYNFIYNNTIYSNNQNGIIFNITGHYRAYIQYNYIYNNTIYSNNKHGIFLYSYYTDNSYFQYNNLYSNTIYLNGKNGIYFYCYAYYQPYIQKNNIYSNTIYSNVQNSICFYSYSNYFSYLQNNNIYFNIIYSNGQNGIYFYSHCREYYYYLQDNNIYSNTIYSNTQNGIYFYSYSDDYYSFRYNYLQNNNIYSNTIYTNNQNGIYVYGNSRNGKLFIQNNMIYSNTIYDHTNGNGIYTQSDNNTVTWQNSNIYNNTLDSNLIGIEFLRINSHIVNINNITNSFYDGIRLNSSTENIIGYNLIANNKENGINLKSSSSNNRIQNNNITSNSQFGIFVNGQSNSNTIIRNDIINHPDTGVNITGATDNYLHHNNFKNNTQSAYDSTTQLNDWDDGTEGNWWDDYTGFDSNNDGIGDIPYDVPGGGSKDWYPIIKPANITAPRIENTTPEDGEKDVAVNTKISITFTNKMNRTATEQAIWISEGLTPKNFIWNNGDMTVTFELSNTLSSETTYTVTVSLSAKDVLENHLENTYKFSFTSEDIIPPTIISTSPVHYSTDIELNASIVVTFSEPMNTTTVSYYCSPDPGSWSILWSKKNSVATFSHKDFGSLTSYIFKITSGKDIGGNDLVAGSVPNPWTFTTKDVIGPEITTTSPPNGTIGVLLNANIVVTFNEQMNTSSVTFSCKPDPGGWVTAWSNGDKTVTYSHNGFTGQTTYTFHITAGKDLAGNTLNPSKPNPWSFKTKDVIPPKITATSPSNGANNVPLNAKIKVTFSEAMDNTTIGYVCNPNTGGWEVNWSSGNTVASFSHNLFNEDTNYTFQITGGKDSEGNDLVAGSVPNPWSFKTPNLAAPQIIATMPINGTIDIILGADIVVIFSETMNTASVAFTCSPNPSGWSVTWSSGDTIATYSHSPFSSLTKYIFQITAGKDLADSDLIKGKIPNPWYFTTKDALAPTVISASPENGTQKVALTSNIVVTFSERMDTSTVAFTCSPNPSGWLVAWSTNDTVATYMHSPFQRFTTYSMHIVSGKDLAGNNLVSGSIPNPWSFTTIGNIAPSILTEPLKTATEEKLYIYDIEAYDSDNDVLDYTLTTHPTGMIIDHSTGVITWLPTNDQVGINIAIVRVSDGNGGIDTQNFTITVLNVNDAPIITSKPLLTATEDVKYNYDVEAYDIDVGDTLTYNLISSPSDMTIHTSMGLITWVPTNDHVGVNFVSVKVIDKFGGTANQSFTITVTNTNDPPVITSTPVTSAIEDTLYIYEVQASDIDPTKDILIFSLTNFPAGMEINPKNGLITWVPTNDQVGLINVVVIVSDGNGGEDSQVFKINVTNVNDPPIIITTPVTSAMEDDQYTYDVDAQDVDINDVLTYNLEKYPNGMVIDSNTGLITWTPTNDQVGVTSVTVGVIDNHRGSAKQPFTITVENMNNPPIITSTPITSANVDTNYIYDINALDIDPTNDDLTFSLITYPMGMNIDTSTGIISWVPLKDQIGLNNVVVLVSDGKDGQNSQSFTISVESPEATDQEEVTKRKGTEQTAVYSIILFIIILIIIFVILLITFFRGKKPSKKDIK